jgi:hypothetical protein
VFSPTFATDLRCRPTAHAGDFASRFKTSPGVTGALKRAFLIPPNRKSFPGFPGPLSCNRTGLRKSFNNQNARHYTFFGKCPKKIISFAETHFMPIAHLRAHSQGFYPQAGMDSDAAGYF